MDLVTAIMDFETGNLTAREEVELFAHLIGTGQAWSLQGSYGRAATWFIEQGLVSPEGEIDWGVYDDLFWEDSVEPDWDAENDEAKLRAEGF